jgi:3-isopropylmalate dehydrogenase
MLTKHKLGLFGAITSKPKKEAETELDPSLRSQGYVYYSPIVTMRQRFNLDICVRPCVGFAGNPLNYIRKRPDGGFEEPQINATIFRQNTEGMYCGIEWTNPSDTVRAALDSHPMFKAFAHVAGRDLAVTARIITRPAAQRIVTAAFEFAKKKGFKAVAICEKPNVLRETSGMMEEVAKEIQRTKFPGIQLWRNNIDAQLMWLNKNPENFNVIVASNLFGDILSDGFAGLIGGLGFAASANIGDEVAVFEPTHGSAPKYAGLNPPIVNPIATILAAAMLVEHVGENEKAKKIWDAVGVVVREGKTRTYDMMRLTGGPQVLNQGAASTPEMTDAILARLNGGI